MVMNGTVVGFTVRVHENNPSCGVQEVRCDSRTEVRALIERADTEDLGLEFETRIRRTGNGYLLADAVEEGFLDVEVGAPVYGLTCEYCGAESWCQDPRWGASCTTYICGSCTTHYEF